jgi:hypothetical protein
MDRSLRERSHAYPDGYDRREDEEAVMAIGENYWKRLTQRLSRRGVLRAAALGGVGAAAGVVGNERVQARPTAGAATVATSQYPGQAATFADLLTPQVTDQAGAQPTTVLQWPAVAPTPGGPSINIFPPNDTRELLIDASWIERTKQKYGANDTRGAYNLITPARVMRAAQLVKTGQILDLRIMFRSGHPALTTDRQYLYNMSARVDPNAIAATMRNPAGSSFIAGLEGRIMYMGDGANGHLDGLAHIGVGDVFYNGNRASDITTATGVTKFGMDTLPPFVTRGVLLDVAKVKGVAMLPDDYVITANDLDAARQLAGVTPEPGDAILIHSGWAEIYLTEPGRFWKTEPGLGRAR